MSNFLGTLTITDGTKETFQTPNSGVKAILIGNESGLTCTVTMQSGGVQKTLYPSVLDWFAVNPGFNGNIVITPQAILSNSSNFPSTTLIFDAIGLNDPENASMYPLSFTRTVNSNVSTPTSIQNDGMVAGTSIVESTVSGDATSTVKLSNDGVFSIGNATHHGSVSFDNGQIVSNGSGFMSISGGLNTGSNPIEGGSLFLNNNAGSQRQVFRIVGGSLGNDVGIPSLNTTANVGKLDIVKQDGTTRMAEFNDAAGITFDSNLTESGTLTVTGDATLNGAGTGLSVANNATVGGTLGVTGVSTLTGEVDAGADVKITANAKSYYGKDHAGTSYAIAGFDGTTNKQLNILDGTSGQLANVKSNTKVNGTLEATGAATLDSTLAVTGTSSLDNGNITTDGSGAIAPKYVNPTPASSTVTGTTHGAYTVYEYMRGIIKRIFVYVQALDSNNAFQTTSLPVAFTTFVSLQVNSNGSNGLTVELIASSVAQVSVAANGASTVVGGFVNGAIDSIGIKNTTAASQTTGWVLIEGV